MRSLLIHQFLGLFLVIATGKAYAQNKIEADNKMLDSLAKPFTTYTIKLIVNDSVSKDPVITEINKELRTHFSFLKKKKFRLGKGDLEVCIRINGTISSTLEHKVYSTIEHNATYYHHKYELNHLSGGSLAFFAKNETIAFVILDSNAIVQRNYSYTETATDYKWMKDDIGASNKKQYDESAATKAKIKSEEIWRFEKDFFQLFANYRMR